jgi:hypothetical protein
MSEIKGFPDAVGVLEFGLNIGYIQYLQYPIYAGIRVTKFLF